MLRTKKLRNKTLVLFVVSLNLLHLHNLSNPVGESCYRNPQQVKKQRVTGHVVHHPIRYIYNAIPIPKTQKNFRKM